MKTKLTDRQLLAEHFTGAQPLRLLAITMSDRASDGEYEDKSGPRLCEHLETFFDGSGISIAIDSLILSDDSDALEAALRKACEGGVHVILTTGGTGVGPRDISTDVVLKLADKVIPGIMEVVRMKYGVDKPCALLSRTVAATMGRTAVYTLPGSRKGVDEYMGEILKSMEHLILVLNGLEVH